MSMRLAIEARSFGIFGFWSHNYWVLRDVARGAVLAELHGLATDRVSGRPVPMGYSKRHSLRAWHFMPAAHASILGLDTAGVHPASGLYADGQRSQVILDGNELDIVARWRAANLVIERINGLDLDYPRGGIKLLGATRNSNSIFTTFGELMGLPQFVFARVVQPGVFNVVVLADPPVSQPE